MSRSPSNLPVLAVIAALLGPSGVLAQGAADRTEVREDCADYDPERNPYFGDTHVHTSLSLDAVLQGTQITPAEAYEFARGQSLLIPPLDENGDPSVPVQLDRPLDFAMVSDHAEFFGEIHTCTTPGLPGYESLSCVLFRTVQQLAFFVFNTLLAVPEEAVSRLPFCGPGGILCLEQSIHPWTETQIAAEAAYDRSADCKFTSFVGYEYTGNPLLSNLHRNVIFRNANVPAVPASYFEAPYAEDLWDYLEQECLAADMGCDALTIPHNSNLSAGRMFETVDRNGLPYSRGVAARRAAFEPLVELIQHKGASECRPGFGVEDELCGFEFVPWATLGGEALGGNPGPGNFVRNALKKGLQLDQTLGANPFMYGFVGSTDTHQGTPGLVNEKNHPGHGGGGALGGTAVGLTELPEYGPGGLAVLWAEENSRDALFAAMLRKEAYATSGTRPIVRFFGGNIALDACESASMVEDAYQDGVPMGGALRKFKNRQLPKFVVSALMDPGTAVHPGTPLQHIQIIKGWVDAQGQSHEEVFDVAGDPNSGATVDLTTCEPLGEGFAELCATWTDVDFDRKQRAFYYARVVESPTCRWQTFQCNDAGVDCAVPASVPEGFEACCDEDLPKTLQERAWTSPIWYEPK